MKVLPTITTVGGSDWRGKIEEARKLRLKEVCFFTTALEREDREEAYELLAVSGIEEIPFVHLRTDLEEEELNLLCGKYGTQVFNIHPTEQFPLLYDYSSYKDRIFIENTGSFSMEEDLERFAGFCIDFSHLENERRTSKEEYNERRKLIEKYPVGCNHISAIKKEPLPDGSYDDHFLEDLSEVDYLKHYPLHYFSPFIAVELVNSLREQLEVAERVREILRQKSY